MLFTTIWVRQGMSSIVWWLLSLLLSTAVACINVFDYDRPSSLQRSIQARLSFTTHGHRQIRQAEWSPPARVHLHVTITSTTEIAARAYRFTYICRVLGSRRLGFVNTHSLHPTEKLWHLKGFYVWKVTFVKRCFYVSFETTAANPFFQYLSRLLY